MKRQKTYVNIDLTTSDIKPVIDYDGNVIDGYYVSSKTKEVYKKEGNNVIKATCYLNKCNSSTSKWKNGYYKVHINKSLYNLHWILARVFKSGYKIGLVVDHIDGDSTNNDINNLQWITRSENTRKYWKSLSDEEYSNYKEKYSNAIKNAHKEGKYKEHLAKMKQRMQNKGEQDGDQSL